jgi:hypothetical protein
LVATHLRLLGLSLGLCLHLRHFLLPLWQVTEPGMLKCVRSGYAHLWPQLEHTVEEAETDLVDLWQYKA